jgi:hypothetical protein
MRATRIVLAAAVLAAVALPAAGKAQGGVVLNDTITVEYAVKALCGRSVLMQPEPPLAFGQYFTSINVHNPRTKAVQFRWKVAVTGPNVMQGPIIGFFLAVLERDGALRIDCNRIRQIVPGAFASPIDVYVIIQTPWDVDVTAVYTASPPPGPGAAGVSTMDVERVCGRRTLILPGTNNPVDSAVGTACGR